MMGAFLRLLFLATKLAMNAMITYVVVVFFQEHILLVLIACYWLLYNFVEILEEEGRVQRLEKMWDEQ